MTDDPGLDLSALRALAPASRRTTPSAITTLLDNIGTHLDAHDGYVAFSGGKDSLVVVALALRVDPNVPVAFFDSGLEFPETYDYIHRIGSEWGVDLHIYEAEPPLLDQLVDTGLWTHGPTPPKRAGDLHTTLITRPAARAHAQHGPGELWGVRADESAGRRALYTRSANRNGVIHRRDGTTAYGPIWDWSDHEVHTFIAREHLPINPVYDILERIGAPAHRHRVGHIMDGAHLDRGRAVWLRQGWPDLFDTLAQALPRLRQMT